MSQYSDSLMPRIMAAVTPIDSDDFTHEQLDAAIECLCVAAASLANQYTNQPNTTALARAAAAVQLVRGIRYGGA